MLHAAKDHRPGDAAYIRELTDEVQERTGWSQRQLADAVGVTRHAILNWTGRSNKAATCPFSTQVLLEIMAGRREITELNTMRETDEFGIPTRLILDGAMCQRITDRAIPNVNSRTHADSLAREHQAHPAEVTLPEKGIGAAPGILVRYTTTGDPDGVTRAIWDSESQTLSLYSYEPMGR